MDVTQRERSTLASDIMALGERGKISEKQIYSKELKLGQTLKTFETCKTLPIEVCKYIIMSKLFH